MKKLLKTLWAQGCCFFHVPDVLSAMRRDVAILCYHRVVPREKLEGVFSTPWMIVYQDSFERQMQYLRDYYNVMTLSTYFLSIKNGERIPKKTVIVTFDDGWEDNYLHAFPVLKRYGIPATIFLTTGFVGTEKIFWPERVIFSLKNLAEQGADRALPVTLPGFFRESSPGRNLEHDWLKWIETMKDMNDSERNVLVGKLEKLSPKMGASQIKSNRLMTWEQAREMRENGIEFGSHGVTHRLLTSLNIADVRKEIQDSRKTMEKKLGVPVDSFAYPNGNYNERIIEILRDEGYALAVSTDPGLNSKHTDLFRLKRICMDEKTLSDYTGCYSKAVFSSYLSGLLG